MPLPGEPFGYAIAGAAGPRSLRSQDRIDIYQDCSAGASWADGPGVDDTDLGLQRYLSRPDDRSPPRSGTVGKRVRQRNELPVPVSVHLTAA